MLGSAGQSSSDSFPGAPRNTGSPAGLNLNSALARDERIDHIKELAFKSFRLKTEKWNLFISTEENQRLLLDFLDHGQCPCLVLFINPGGNLTHYTEVTSLYAVETLVVQWSHLISDVLRLDSAQLILQGGNPGPSAEIKFWQRQMENLQGIYEQLQNPKVCKIKETLNKTRSSYYSGFNQLIMKVEEALSEAQDISLYLSPLKHYIAYLEESSFSNIERLIAPLFHAICLIWTHSKHYSFPNRIVVVLQEFCNLLIDRVREMYFTRLS
ncbi:dynein beta chain, ciliary-like [Pogona vitticeps]